MSAKDKLSGVSKIELRINGSTWTPYTGPFDVTTEGSNIVEYRSMDIAGNVEDTKSVTVVTTDDAEPITTPPVASNITVTNNPVGTPDAVRPPFLPLALDAARPALVRSTITFRSN